MSHFVLLTAATTVLLKPRVAVADCGDCKGDLDNSGKIDLPDLSVVLANFGSTGVTSSHPAFCADFNGDGSINVTDLSMILTSYGSYCEMVDQPENSAGAARGWQASMPLSKFSELNLASGNLLTVVPLDACDPVGPAIGFVLYHNSAHAQAGRSGGDGQGFALGVGWSTSYSAHIVGTSISTTVKVIADDGSENTFAHVGSAFVSPAGIYDRLTRIEDPEQPDSGIMVWILTRRDQSKLAFADAGNLIRQIDSAGNVVRIARDSEHSNRITHISSAAEGLTDVTSHRVVLSYDDDQLSSYTDVLGRVWTFSYNADNRLSSIGFPSGSPPWDPNIPAIAASSISFEYDTGGSTVGRISQIVDRDGMKWKYAYDYTSSTLNPSPARVQRVENWGNASATSAITTMTVSPSLLQLSLNQYKKTITDARGKAWKAYLAINPTDAVVRLMQFEDPLSKFRSQTFDSSHNVASTTDELGNTWTMTWGPVGNITSATSPLAATGDPNSPVYQTWTYDWEAVGGSGTNFYRLTKITEPGNNSDGSGGAWTEYEYGDSNDPTLVTLVRENPDGVTGSVSNVESETTIEYYGVSTPKARGQLKLITDANGVQHEFTYDKWGYLASSAEGILAAPLTGTPEPCIAERRNDAAGRGISAGNSGEAGVEGEIGFDANGNPVKDKCLIVAYSGSAPRRLGIHPAPERVAPFHHLKSAQFDIVGRPTTLARFSPDFIDPPLGDGTLEDSRDHAFTYDALGRPTGATTTSYHDTTVTFARSISFSYAITGGTETAGPTSITGPDSQTATITYDDLGRESTVTRGGMSATIAYDDAGRVIEVTYGNGMKTVTTYDEAGRTTQIRHQNSSAVVLLKYDYAWNRDNTLESRTETDNVAGMTATVGFSYDKRKRLIREQRWLGTTAVYDLSYAYDELGNRLHKLDNLSGRRTAYFYDSDPANRDEAFLTNNNRLVWYDEYAPLSGGGEAVVRTVKYLYYKTGDVSNITVKDHYVNSTLTPGSSSDYDWHYDLALYYYRDKSLRVALWNRFKVNSSTGVATDYEPLTAREFRFDSGRARYAAIDYDTHGSDNENSWTRVGNARWTDYIGDTPYRDIDLSSSGGSGGATLTQTPTNRYFGLGGDETLNSSGTVTDTRYWHGDLIASTGMLTHSSGSGGSGGVAAETTAFTAFGEPVRPNGSGGYALGGATPSGWPRYAYASGYGYEADGLTLVGANSTLAAVRLTCFGGDWYDAGIGRVLQADNDGSWCGVWRYSLGSDDLGLATDPRVMVTTSAGGQRVKFVEESLERALNRLKQVGKVTDRLARTALNLQHIQQLRNSIYLDQYGPLAITLAVLHYACIQPTAADAADWGQRAIRAREEINRRRIARQGGFTPRETGEIWGY